MRPRNIEAIGWWDQMLKAGKRQVAVCGSDYHEDTVFQRLANPTLNVLAWSPSEKDLLEAIESGHSYFTYSPTDLHVDLYVEDATYGVIKHWREGLQATLNAFALEACDQIRLIDQDGSRILFDAPQKGDWQSNLKVMKPGYIRLEIWRTFFPGLPSMPALVTNPIWFD